MILQKLFPSKASPSSKGSGLNAVRVSLFVRKNKWLILLCLLSLFFLFSLFGSESDSAEKTQSHPPLSEYSALLRSELEVTLSEMSGVGKCKVLITFSDDGERVYALDEERNGTDSERYEYVLVSSRSEGLILKIYTPCVRGVAVICEGGDSTRVKNDVTEVLSNTLGISADRISVKKLG